LWLTIIEHLRAGELYQLQEKLLSNQCYEHLLMLNSTNPIFDNIEFKEEIEDTEDLFQTDLERQQSILSSNLTYAETENDNTAYGNRNYLMFIQQYHDVFKNAISSLDGSPEGELDQIRKAILGL
jgi:hypothetical protein